MLESITTVEGRPRRLTIEPRALLHAIVDELPDAAAEALRALLAWWSGPCAGREGERERGVC